MQIYVENTNSYDGGGDGLGESLEGSGTGSLHVRSDSAGETRWSSNQEALNFYCN